MSLSARQEESQLERPPDYADYRPARTTAEGGATMLLQFALNLGQETGLTALGVGGRKASGLR